MSKLRRARFRMWLKQEKRCYYCARRTFLPQRGQDPHKQTATFDHIIPLSEGGAYSPTQNTVVACHQCNNERGTRDARIFLLEKMGVA